MIALTKSNNRYYMANTFIWMHANNKTKRSIISTDSTLFHPIAMKLLSAWRPILSLCYKNCYQATHITGLASRKGKLLLLRRRQEQKIVEEQTQKKNCCFLKPMRKVGNKRFLGWVCILGRQGGFSLVPGFAVPADRHNNCIKSIFSILVERILCLFNKH